MQKHYKTKFVFDKNAVTLLESLMAMFVMTFLSALLLQWIMVINQTTNDFHDQKQMVNYENYILEDLIITQEIAIENNKIILKTYDEKKISYEFTNNRVVRKVNNKGSELIMNDVEEIRYKNSNNKVVMEVKFEDNQQYKEILGGTFL